MARGQEVRYTLTGDSRGLVSAAAGGAASLDKLGAAAQRSTSKAGQFSAAIGATSTTMARSAAAFGLPIGPLRLLDDAADIAAIGFGNLSKAAIGFNAATVGVVGAGLAVGYMLGGLIRQLPGVAAAADNAAASLVRLFTSQKELDKQASAMSGLDDFRKNIGAVHAAAQQRQIAALGPAGALRMLKGDRPLTENEKLIASIEKQMAAAKKAQGVAKQLAEEWVKGMEAARKANDDFNKSFKEGTIEAAHDLQDVLNKRAAARSEADVEDMLARTGILSDEVAGPAREDILGLAEAADKAAQALLKMQDNIGKIVNAIGLASDVLDFLGVSADSKIQRTLGQVGRGVSLGSEVGGIFGPKGAAIGAAIGGVVGLFKGLFGGGPSKEEREAERKRAEEERARITAAARDMRARGIESLAATGGAFFAGRRPAPGTVMSPDDARRQGSLFAAAWGTVVKEKGIVAAADAFGEAFKNMKADFEAAGIEPPAWFQEISGQVDLGLDEGFRNVAQAAQTAAQFLLAFAEAGGTLNAETLAAFEQEARAAFGGGKQAALNLGQGEEQAVKAGFAAANPLLRGLLDQSIVQGVTLSEDIQAMIEAAGIVPSEIVQQLDELRAIRKAVESLAGVGSVTGGNGNVIGIPHDLPEFQRGGDTDRVREGAGGGGFPAILHANETVVPDEDIPDFLRAHGGNSGSVASALGAIAAEVRSRPPVTVQQPVTITANVGNKVTQDDLDDLGDQIARAVADGRHPLIRALQKQGFRRN